MTQLKPTSDIMLWIADNIIVKKSIIAREFFHAKSGKPSQVGAGIFIGEMVLRGYLRKTFKGNYACTQKMYNWANREKKQRRKNAQNSI